MFFGRKIILRISGFAVILTVWQFAGRIRASPALPSPLNVLRTAVRLIRDGVFTEHIMASLTIILLGIGIAVLLGFSPGVLMFRHDSFKVAILPVVESIRGVAALTLFPLLIDDWSNNDVWLYIYNAGKGRYSKYILVPLAVRHENE